MKYGDFCPQNPFIGVGFNKLDDGDDLSESVPLSAFRLSGFSPPSELLPDFLVALPRLVRPPLECFFLSVPLPSALLNCTPEGMFRLSGLTAAEFEAPASGFWALFPMTLLIDDMKPS